MRHIPDELAKRYKDEGWWTGETIGELVGHGLSERGDLAFEVHSTSHPYVGTFAEVELIARRLAAGLRDRGVGPGDVVVAQLPNWMEAAATFWATSFLGAVIVPVVHFYGPKEMSHIIATTKPKVVITADGFGKMTYEPDLYRDVPIVGVVGLNFDDLLADEPMTGIVSADPAAPALIAFTSGTTSKAKGVIHSHQTLVCETRQLASRWPRDGQPQITGAPIGHFIGMVSAFLIPILEGYPVHLIDVWDPAVVLRLMIERELQVGGGAPYFVTSVLDHPDFTTAHLKFMIYAGLGGASVPLTFTRRLTELGVIAHRSYGSTEHPSITGSKTTDPVTKRTQTDGSALAGVELKIAPDGEILSRGPDLCIGYTDDVLTANTFDSDGWYHTGDIGILDEHGSLTITDRKNDVIIRGGENISAQEVEEELLGLPGVAEAAAVSAPDARLGERTAAVLRLHPGAAMPTLDELRAHFAASGLAKQKWPEEIHQLDEFPRTPSGKVQKAAIRKIVGGQNRITGTAATAT